MSKASLQQWLQRLENIHPTDVELGLERISLVAHALQLLPVQQPVITVAGTNGKGSTVAVLESLLRATGVTTGAFTSPHLLHFNERIRVAGVEVEDQEIVVAFGAIEIARGETTLTYFEFAALAALLIFRERNPDIIILEVGLGGRLDAVNIVDPTVAVITSIDLDHQNWLGETRGEIAREKAGIVRPGVPVVIADPAPPVELLHCVTAAGADPVVCLGREFRLKVTADQWQVVLQARNGEQRQLPTRPSGSLLPENICAALQAALLLGVEFSDDNVAQALLNVEHTGRRQWLELQGVGYVLDVAHNPAAVSKLVEYLDVTYCNGETKAIFSCMSDKDIQGIVAAAAGHFDAWFVADQPHNERAATAADVATLLRGVGVNRLSLCDDLSSALRQAQRSAKPGDRLVIFGSFYTVAEVLPQLAMDHNKREVQ